MFAGVWVYMQNNVDNVNITMYVSNVNIELRMRAAMKVLLVYPEFVNSFWSFTHALRFIGKKAAMPPVGLLTVASMLPDEWEKELVDLNVENLNDRVADWPDMVMVSAMNAQKKSASRIVDLFSQKGVTVVAGGPLFSNDPEEWSETVDHLFVGEAEDTLPAFIEDLASGRGKKVYRPDGYPSMESTPLQELELIDIRKYNSMGIQFSRGCPHNCDFCNITSLFGRKVRTKTTEQVIGELDSLYRAGWREGIFFVDDNFIGNRRYLKESLLPAVIHWRESHGTVHFQTETSILLADDQELMEMMVAAGFNTVFIGIETTDEESLKGCGKTQNTGRDLLADVKRIQNSGLEVEGGFIVGFDGDSASVFQKQWEFIQRSGIVTAMVAMLQAPEGTRLYERLREEGRIHGEVTDGTDGTTNIVPLMDTAVLEAGYRSLVEKLYTPKAFYQRIKTFLGEFRPSGNLGYDFSLGHVMAVPKSVLRLGIVGRERLEYWKLVFWTLFKRPVMIPLALKLAIYGYHFSRTLAGRY